MPKSDESQIGSEGSDDSNKSDEGKSTVGRNKSDEEKNKSNIGRKREKSDEDKDHGERRNDKSNVGRDKSDEDESRVGRKKSEESRVGKEKEKSQTGRRKSGSDEDQDRGGEEKEEDRRGDGENRKRQEEERMRREDKERNKARADLSDFDDQSNTGSINELSKSGSGSGSGGSESEEADKKKEQPQTRARENERRPPPQQQQQQQQQRQIQQQQRQPPPPPPQQQQQQQYQSPQPSQESKANAAQITPPKTNITEQKTELVATQSRAERVREANVKAYGERPRPDPNVKLDEAKNLKDAGIKLKHKDFILDLVGGLREDGRDEEEIQRLIRDLPKTPEEKIRDRDMTSMVERMPSSPDRDKREIEELHEEMGDKKKRVVQPMKKRKVHWYDEGRIKQVEEEPPEEPMEPMEPEPKKPVVRQKLWIPKWYLVRKKQEVEDECKRKRRLRYKQTARGEEVEAENEDFYITCKYASTRIPWPDPDLFPLHLPMERTNLINNGIACPSECVPDVRCRPCHHKCSEFGCKKRDPIHTCCNYNNNNNECSYQCQRIIPFNAGGFNYFHGGYF